ncbi:MAG: ATP-binding protein [Bacteroidales bacterium]|nr:ATP-binding protein [Bacteroidales bacterium]
MYYIRNLEGVIIHSLKTNPVTAIIGPRQCGKSTLAKHIISRFSREVVYLDLERPTDLQKLENAEWFLSNQKGKLVCLDEIQRKPDLFPLIRSLVDEWGANGHFLILGSASRDLIKQGSESLAGRISYKQLTPFLLSELGDDFTVETYLVKGGFPRSILKINETDSFEWRQDFISTFLERDLLLWSGFSTDTMRKLWQMLAHLNGQLINYSLLANALGISSPTARNYVELLSSTFMVKLLQPYLVNTGKRLVKSPKVYIHDVGIANALLGINNFIQLSGHPSVGSAWETLVLTNLSGFFPKLNFYFYRTNHGAEIDFIIESNDQTIAVECKSALKPSLSRGTYTAIDDIGPLCTLIVSPVKSGWPLKPGIDVVNLQEAITKIQAVFGS